MKQRVLFFLVLSLLLPSCALPGERTALPEETVFPAAETGTGPASESPAATEEETTAEIIARAIVESQPDRWAFTAQTGEDLEFYITELYGLEVGIKDAAVYIASGVDGREVAVVRLTSMTSEGTKAVAALEEYRQDRLGDFLGYSPDQAALVEGGEVVGGWYCVALLLCEDMEAAKAAFEEAAGQASVYVPPETALSAEAGETTAPVGLTPAETRWLIPFDPPNAFDMTPYDISAILTAWETGEEKELGDRDSLILAKARAVLSECSITDEMSDYEKERLLHDWMVENISYDRTVHDHRTPMGQVDNLNPYGTLVNGYGICLGYATTFQLLMDMAGVECITVVGASNESRQDHAWNMVRLAGEWYCVDVTWDDSTIYDSDTYTEEQLDRIHHTYFNVTSRYMRSTNHQWDYQNTPEATAEDYGKGAVDPKERAHP